MYKIDRLKNVISSQIIFLRSETTKSIAFCKNILPQKISKKSEDV